MEAVETDEAGLVAALRGGDEAVFAELVDRYSASMRRVALSYVRTGAVADEVVQETWLGVLRGIDRFEGRSSFKTWLFRILANVAKTRAQREARSVPFSSLERELAEGEPAVEPERFRPSDATLYPGGWADPPGPWGRLEAAELRDVVAAAIEKLPAGQRVVISLRDVEGWSSGEVCNVLEISETNQRVLLHRARSTVRATVERYLS